ncbi:MAG: FecR family protein [Tannerellaceae bacterium]
MNHNIEQTDFDELAIQYMNNSLGEAGKKKLYQLLQTDPNNQERFDQLSLGYAFLQVPEVEKGKTSNYIELQKLINNKNEQAPKRYTLYQQLLGIVAAIFLFIAGASSTYYLLQNKDNHLVNNDSYITTTVPNGSKSKLTLEDGTEVWLNGGSIFTYNSNFGKTNREVTLKGEGYFEVQKNKQLPFIVTTNTLDVLVTGTTFNISAYDDDVNTSVVLVEGEVKVETDKQQITLVPDQELNYDSSSNTTLISNIDASRIGAWKNNQLVFTNEPLPSILKKLERAYDTTIKLESNKAKNEIFTGSINLNQSIIDVINYLDVDNKYTISRLKDTLILKER